MIHNVNLLDTLVLDVVLPSKRCERIFDFILSDSYDLFGSFDSEYFRSKVCFLHKKGFIDDAEFSALISALIDFLNFNLGL